MVVEGWRRSSGWETAAAVAAMISGEFLKSWVTIETSLMLLFWFGVCINVCWVVVWGIVGGDDETTHE